MKLAIGYILIAAALSGCGASEGGANLDTKSIAQIEQRLNRFGFGEPSEVRRVLTDLRTAAVNGDKQTLVNLVHYPLTSYHGGVPIHRYLTANDILASYDAVYSERVLHALKNARFEELFIRDQGAMIGDGEVWLFPFEEGVRVKAINSGKSPTPRDDG